MWWFGVGVVSLSAAAAAWVTVWKYGRRRMYELANVAGEGGLPMRPLIGHLHLFSGNTQGIMKSLQKVCYAAMRNPTGLTSVWIGHILYFLSVDPADIECIQKTCLEKDDLHRFMRNVIGNGIVFAPVSIWRRRRKVMVPAFSPKIVESFAEVFAEQSEILARQLEPSVGQGPIDLWPYFSSYTLDSVCETAMGVKIGAQTNDKVPFLTSMNHTLNLVCERIFKIWQQPDWLYKLNPAYKWHQHYIQSLHKFTDDIIKAKRTELENLKLEENVNIQEKDENHNERKTFLGLLISQSNKEKGYTNLELREEVISLTIAGTDTSAVGTCFTLLLLARHQDIQERVYQELLDVYGSSTRSLVKEDFAKMMYLDRVIKESLRLYTPVPFIIRKIEEETTLPSGRILAKGSGTAIGIWGVHRNPNFWGPDAEEFKPDRFEDISHLPPCTYMPFSAAPRKCLGYQYAMMSMKTSIAAVLRKYRLTVPEGTDVSQPIPTKIDIMLKAADGYNVVLQPRDRINGLNQL